MTRPRNTETKIDRNSYGTPPAIIEMARDLMGSIDCDPASNFNAQAVVRALYWCGHDHPDANERDGLKVAWGGNVWLNPPYGLGGVRPFVDRLLTRYASRGGCDGDTCVLVNNITETAAGQLLLQHCDAVWFPSYRIAFLHPETGEPVKGNGYSQMMCYFVNDETKCIYSREVAKQKLVRTLAKHNLPGVVL